MPSDTDKYKNVGQRLRRARLALNWSQEELARAINTTAVSISRWERGVVLPQPHYREQLCRVFNTTAEALFEIGDAEQQDEESALPTIWHVPYHRNPLFTGREEILARLHDALHTTSDIARQALSGLGGVGKTQTALEYAYRYREDYSAVLWVRAETREIFLADLIALAEPLNLPERRENDQERILEAVKRWLCDYDGWLLILDNVEDVTAVTDMFPTNCQGYTLLTTRSQATGSIAQRIDVAPMEPDESTPFLLRRAKLIVHDAALTSIPEHMYAEANRLSQVLGGLPLALDQAGAYIEETGCNMTDYLDRYQKQPVALLNRRGTVASDHPSSVLTTFSLSFQQIEQMQPAVVDLLRLCAFLQPDTIPEELFHIKTPSPMHELSSIVIDSIQFDEALAILRRYSLLKRDPHSKTLTIHRLVQAATQAHLSQEMHQTWAERALFLVNILFPDITYRSHRQITPALLSQAYWSADLITRWNVSTQEAMQLLLKLVAYVQWKGELQSAGRLLDQAEALSVQQDIVEIAEAIPLWNLQAHQACEQGKYREAEEFARRSLRWSKRIFGPTHELVASSLESLVEALFSLGKYDEALPLTEQALQLKKQMWGEEDARIVETLNNLSNIYYRLEQYEKSAQILHQAVEVANNTPDFDRLILALIYGSLGFVYRDMERFTEAIAFLEEALKLRENLDLSNHPYQALTLNDLSGCFFRQGNYVEAERVLRQAFTIQQQSLHPEHEAIAITINNLAKNLAAQDKDTEAEGLYQQALALFEQALGEEHMYVSIVLINLAMLAEKQGSLAKAALFYQRALKIQESVLGSEHPKVIQIAGWYKNVQSLV